jgi:hypothetical protein
MTHRTDQPQPCHTIHEVAYYLMATPCPSCQSGPLTIDAIQPIEPPGRIVDVQAVCSRCDARTPLRFELGVPADQTPPPDDAVNDTDQPSELIDLSQWLGLHAMFVQQAQRAPSAADARQAYRQARLCLAEAVKFYPDDDELPPAEAFFTDQGRQAFRDHPENFARRRLMDLRDRLPTRAAQADAQPQPPADPPQPRRRWWKFWQHP